MLQLTVTANKLNKRNSIPSRLPEAKGITGVVNKGFSFAGEEVEAAAIPNTSLGKWYRDRDGSFYWGGGLITVGVLPLPQIAGMPVNLPAAFRFGVDVSHHNENPDWDAFKNAGAGFVFIKTSEGVGTRDARAAVHTANSKSRGLKTGYYHFCRPDTRNGGTVTSDAAAEANEALQIINVLGKPDLPLVLDLEEWGPGKDSPLGKNDYLTWVNTFIKTVKDKGIECMIYSRKNYLEEKLPADHNLGNIKLWLAFYPDKPDLNKVAVPHGWTDWSIWQYTEKGSIGKSTPLDINILKDSTLF